MFHALQLSLLITKAQGLASSAPTCNAQPKTPRLPLHKFSYRKLTVVQPHRALWLLQFQGAAWSCKGLGMQHLPAIVTASKVNMILRCTSHSQPSLARTHEVFLPPLRGSRRTQNTKLGAKNTRHHSDWWPPHCCPGLTCFAPFCSLPCLPFTYSLRSKFPIRVWSGQG